MPLKCAGGIGVAGWTDPGYGMGGRVLIIKSLSHRISNWSLCTVSQTFALQL